MACVPSEHREGIVAFHFFTVPPLPSGCSTVYFGILIDVVNTMTSYCKTTDNFVYQLRLTAAIGIAPEQLFSMSP